ncbi:hypothetical protein BPAE_0140g00160 [Botrytis paeoniae]|uniref:Uncharacterized protein n=1 Tax=Botrytis paeoniae TaxID=278948 RepID=A0A4Z1FKP4_9HELO|nr:hypothetical protein BPAE_0140g00160 [Botrytis paeoniae]
MFLSQGHPEARFFGPRYQRAATPMAQEYDKCNYRDAELPYYSGLRVIWEVLKSINYLEDGFPYCII